MQLESSLSRGRLTYRISKRFLDLLITVPSLIVLSPILILVALLIKATSRGPVFYRGVRSGLHGKPFRLMKFRTMVQNAEKIGGPSTGKNDPRVTAVGKVLRRYKLDELPNLLNVVLGEMSLVGPRPEVPVYTNLYEGEEKLILEVKPGITDFSSLHFIQLDEVLGEKNADEVYETQVKPIKNKLRVQYAKEASLALDFKILALTLLKLVRRRR